MVIKDEQEILILSENSYFGKDLLIFNNKSDYTYWLYNSTVDLFVISQAEYINILKLYPQEKIQGEKRAYLRRKYIEKVECVMIELAEIDVTFGEKV